MTITFRPARARDGDAVPLVYSAGPEAFDYLFAHGDISARDYLSAVFPLGGGQLGYRAHFVGESGGRVVAAGTWFSGETTLRYTAIAAKQIASFYGLGAPRVMIRGLRLEQLIRPPPKRTCYLAHLGVTSTLTGQGLGTQLIEHLIAEGRAAGLSTASLDVSAKNPRAQALYERLGFRVRRETRSTLPGVADVCYMDRAI